MAATGRRGPPFQPSVVFKSLSDARETLLEAAEHSRPIVVAIGRVRVRDAAAAAALLDLRKRQAVRKGRRVSEVSNELAVGHLVAASGILLFIDGVLLPALEKEPCISQPLIEALDDCGRQLRDKARAIGGTFQTQAAVLCDLISGYYRCTPVQMPEGLMRDAIKRMLARAKALLDSTCTITDMDVV